MKAKTKLGQVWIETVLYTLVVLVLIGITLALITPRINQARERALIEQTISSLNLIDEKILNILDRGPGNVRKVDIVLRKGTLYVDGSKEQIVIILEEISKPFSEPSVNISYGRINVKTVEERKNYNVELTISYNNRANVKFEGTDRVGIFHEASIPYTFVLSNEGASEGLTIINISSSNAGVSSVDSVPTDAEGDNGEETSCGETFDFVTPDDATASSYNGNKDNFHPSRSIDESMITQWRSDAGEFPQWIYFDLGSKKCISGVRTFVNGLVFLPLNIDIDVSDDGENWEKVLTDTDLTISSDWEERNFDTDTGRYVRILVNSNGGAEFGSFHEVRIRTSPFV